MSLQNCFCESFQQKTERYMEKMEQYEQNGNISSHTHDWSKITGKTPGTIKSVVSNKTVSVANGWKLVNLVSFQVPPGVWLILVQATWDPGNLATVAQNSRGLYISRSTTSVTNQADERVVHEGNYAQQMIGVLGESTEKTYYILGRHNFPSALNVVIYVDMFRLN